MDTLLDEVESLEAILMDDVKIIRNAETGTPEIIETTVFPIVGDDTDQQYICVTLQVIPSPQYPDVSPIFKLQRPRGLDDARLADIKDACTQKLMESVGFPVVFDLIEVIREHLTGSNLPCGQCVICLYGFQDGDEFTKTECYHYLHSYCLARHLVASRRNHNEEQDKLPLWQRKLSKPFEPVCPVCREPIQDAYDSLRTAMPPAELETAPEFQLTDQLKDLQGRMANLYFHQKRRGGIIEVGADESNVISIEPEERSNEGHKPSEDTVDSTSASQHSTDAQIVPPAVRSQPNVQTPRQQFSRSNHHSQRSGGNRNTTPSSTGANTPRVNSDAESNNHSHRHRRHYNRGRRHHNYGHNHQSQQSQSQGHANDHTACSSNSR